jgi:thiamine transport system substrate-binding protein
MKNILFYFLLLAFLLASCTPASTPAPSGPQTINVITHDSFAIGEETIKAFETENNAKVVFLQAGDAGSVLNQAILTKDALLADVLFGVDNTFLSRALDADIFEAYQSPVLADIPDEFKLDPSNRALPVDYGDVCINYDKKYFADKNLPVPQSFEDLAKPEYKDLLVVENPATSSPGLAFLLATRAHFGDGYLDYWKSLKENGVVVVDGWETAYYQNFSASSGKGPQTMVLSYASSPAAEVFFASPQPTEAPTASIVAADMCFRQIEFVGILKNAQNKPLAQKFVDFMLSQKFQEDMPLNMFVYPVNKNAKLPEVFVKYADVAQSPAVMPADEIAANRDAWIEAWTKAMK